MQEKCLRVIKMLVQEKCFRVTKMLAHKKNAEKQ